jgi:hypothetical protein
VCIDDGRRFAGSIEESGVEVHCLMFLQVFFPIKVLQNNRSPQFDVAITSQDNGGILHRLIESLLLADSIQSTLPRTLYRIQLQHHYSRRPMPPTTMTIR